ncbi:MAG: hypothetical protein E6X19_02605 [Hungatella hathewayi]|jgi:hypothetical protein|uniref:hypothetical protein n=1 Tax=Hungatella hathewayi TaxID=154046 RepID=UPI0029152464|nr:hypothetical protein [Hungatella hathewayi]
MKREDNKTDGIKKFQIKSKDETEFITWEQYEKEMEDGKLSGVDFPEYEEE